MYLLTFAQAARVLPLLALLLPRVVHAEPVMLAPRRHVVLSEIPSGQLAEFRVAADIPTVVRFESELDPSGTRFLEQGPATHEWLDLSGQLLLLKPPVGAWLWPPLRLQVRLVDGTLLAFVLVPGPPALADVQVDVFLHPATPGALRAALEAVRAEHEALKLEHARSQAELARYREDEFNPDLAIAVLLLDDEASQHLLKEKGEPLKVSSPDVEALSWFVRLAGRSVYARPRPYPPLHHSTWRQWSRRARHPHTSLRAQALLRRPGPGAGGSRLAALLQWSETLSFERRAWFWHALARSFQAEVRRHVPEDNAPGIRAGSAGGVVQRVLQCSPEA